uniref:DUF1041 domain-containing protein n=1 Tax=Heterorhabditis bacteriophora TaxID=37862 RepID=A0A1I7W939_HETBA
MARGKSREDFESPLVTNIRSKPTDVWNNIYDYVGEILIQIISEELETIPEDKILIVLFLENLFL